MGGETNFSDTNAGANNLSRKRNRKQIKSPNPEVLQGSYYSHREAYDLLCKYEQGLTLRAFDKRLEDGSLPYVTMGGHRWINKEVLDLLIVRHTEYYTLNEAFILLSSHESGLSPRAFHGRVERKQIPSVKFGGRRWIAKSEMAKLMEFFTVRQLNEMLDNSGVNVSKNTLNRRLDRDQISHTKRGGLRVVHLNDARDVVMTDAGMVLVRGIGRNSGLKSIALQTYFTEKVRTHAGLKLVGRTRNKHWLRDLALEESLPMRVRIAAGMKLLRFASSGEDIQSLLHPAIPEDVRTIAEKKFVSAAEA